MHSEEVEVEVGTFYAQKMEGSQKGCLIRKGAILTLLRLEKRFLRLFISQTLTLIS